MASQFTAKKMKTSTLVEGRERGNMIILKAANDNRAPLSFRFKQILFLGAPIAAAIFFGLVWLTS